MNISPKPFDRLPTEEAFCVSIPEALDHVEP